MLLSRNGRVKGSHTVITNQLGNRMEGMTSPHQENPARKFVRFHIVLPEIPCELFTFLPRQVCRGRGVGNVPHPCTGRIWVGVAAMFGFETRGAISGGHSDVFWDIDVDDAHGVGDGPVDVRLCAVNLVSVSS